MCPANITYLIDCAMQRCKMGLICPRKKTKNLINLIFRLENHISKKSWILGLQLEPKGGIDPQNEYHYEI